MKSLALVGLKACARCRRVVAFLMTEDGEHTLGIALDASKAREVSGNYQEPEEKSLTDFLLRLLALFSYVPRQVVLESNKEGFLSARMEIVKGGETEILSCSPQEGVVYATAAGIPLYAAEGIFEQRHLFHPPDTEGEAVDLLQPKLKPTLH
ncbi:MAG: hypothetical protein ACE5JO_04355 [Candidatus Binatia bacterium]